ncbi:MAG TPA: glycosyltransferase [Microlunatus sp.]|nr:glycosyltransferase [Microlunatus sp.]
MELLTFGALWENREVEDHLRVRGVFPPGLILRNLWHDFRVWDGQGSLQSRLARLPQVEPATPIGAVEVTCERGSAGERSYDQHGEPLRVDSYRADGTLLCRGMPVIVDGQHRRHHQFFWPDGSASVLLGSAWDFYYLWLDELIGTDPAIIVNESKTTARFMSRYANPHATVIHKFHESHLAGEASHDPYKGALVEPHRRILPHLDRFDAVVFLTERQRRDVIARFGGGANLHTITNAGPQPVQLQRTWFDHSRRGDRGIVVATLNPLKRLEHAVRAIAEVRGHGLSPTLDVFGRDAGSRADIEASIAQTGTQSAITLHGYTVGAAQHFAEASFSLMTSITEGQSLVLLEAMAAGCVPISYDIRYGPSELIVDGETGFLVPAGDLDALAATLRRFLGLSGRTLRRLRRQCQERVTAFSDDVVFDRWVQVQRAAVTRSTRRLLLTDLAVQRVEVAEDSDTLTVAAELSACWDATRWTSEGRPVPEASLLLVGRRTGVPSRLPMRLQPTVEPGPGAAPPTGFRAFLAFDPQQLGLMEKVNDVYVELACEATARRVRLRGEARASVAGGEIFATNRGNTSLRALGRG